MFVDFFIARPVLSIVCSVLLTLAGVLSLDSLPIARRLMDLLEARGWRGWTKLERIGTAQT